MAKKDNEEIPFTAGPGSGASEKLKALQAAMDKIEKNFGKGSIMKLGDENIKLIAGVLPEVSEQVILFMLKKDWKYTGLDSYVGAAYCIDKKAEEAFASIRKMEEL